jgi:FkbM family methyltransferase
MSGSLSEVQVEDQSFLFFIRDNEDYIQSLHAQGQLYEQDELLKLREYVKLGGVLVEIGSNVGNHTVFMAKCFHPRRIYVVEPNPYARSLLEINCKLNMCGVVDFKYASFAISDRGAFGTMSFSKDNIGAATISLFGGEIIVVPGDQLFSNERVDMIKIDVEGMENLVLSGLSETIRRCKPIIFIEVCDGNLKSVEAFFIKFGYRLEYSLERHKTQHNRIYLPNSRDVDS